MKHFFDKYSPSSLKPYTMVFSTFKKTFFYLDNSNFLSKMSLKHFSNFFPILHYVGDQKRGKAVCVSSVGGNTWLFEALLCTSFLQEDWKKKKRFITDGITCRIQSKMIKHTYK